MALFTTYCDACERVALEDERALQGADKRCPACGNLLRIVPGCSLTEEERGLFDDLKEVVAERTISVDEARSLARQLAGAVRTGQDQGLLDRLTMRLPGLLPIQVAAGANVGAKHRALKVLRAILEAKATSHRS
jgi:hypothetical protein